MLPRRVFRVIGCMEVVSVRNLSVVSGLLVIAGFVMLRCLTVVVSSLRMMMGCLSVMVRCCL